MCCPGFGIIGPVDQSANSRVNHRPCAHGTRLNRDKEIAISNAVIAKRAACFAQGNNLGVCCGIMVGEIAIEPPAHDSALVDHHRSDRDFAHFQRALGRAQGFLHPEFVEFGSGQHDELRETLFELF
jgi:hypothetical protein